MNRIIHLFILFLCCGNCFAWSSAHEYITEAAFNVLPEWQKRTWNQTQYDPVWDVNNIIASGLIKKYCYYPDMLDGPLKPGFLTQKRKISFFLYAEKDGNRVHPIGYGDTDFADDDWTYHYFEWEGKENYQRSYRGAKWYFEKSINAFRRGDASTAAQFLGSFAHAVEDRSSPYHCLDGAAERRNCLWPEDAHIFFTLSDVNVNVDIENYKPTLLGETADKAADKFARRFERMNQYSRKLLPQLVKAHKEDDWKKGISGAKSDAIQSQMASECAKLVADIFYTSFYLAYPQKADTLDNP